MPRFSLLLFLFFLRFTLPAQNQCYDDFHDQNLSQHVLWQGDTSHFVVNSARQLQLNQSAAGSSVLWTQLPVQTSDTLSFEFWLRENFSPSSLNFGCFYLYADATDLPNAPNALYIRFGESGSADAIRLFSRVQGTDSLLGSGPLGDIAAPFSRAIRFLYTNGTFQLWSSSTSIASHELLFNGAINIPSNAPYGGLYFVYSAANADAFYFDDFYFGKALSQQNENLILTEIMADPDTLLGLPASEYVEVFNAGTELVQLKGLKLQDGNSTCTLPSYWLEPEAYVVLVGTNQSSGFNLENALEVSAFLSLNNSGEWLRLLDQENLMIDEVNYSASWYPDSLILTDGISLERRSLLDPCSNEDNWSACLGILGGTPGQFNSINDTLPDEHLPTLIEAEVLDAHYVALEFSEPIDSLTLVNANFIIVPDLGSFQRLVFSYDNCINSAQCLLVFSQEIPKSTPFEIQIENIADCWLNFTTMATSTVRYEAPSLGELKINELLFDPPNEGEDFVELYNNSQKYLELSGCGIHNGQDSIYLTACKISPQQYLALSSDTHFLTAFYPYALQENLKEINLPYFYNDSGSCVLFNDITILDSLRYSASWHFPLLPDSEGFSLERLNFNASTQDPENWFSAAASYGGATPGRANSQQGSVNATGALSLSFPELSPDLDGYHDQLEVTYQMNAAALFASASIFTLEGQKLKDLLINESIGTTGQFFWDGSTQFGTLAPSGIYVLYFQAFSTNLGVFFEKKILFSVCYKA